MKNIIILLAIMFALMHMEASAGLPPPGEKTAYWSVYIDDYPLGVDVQGGGNSDFSLIAGTILEVNTGYLFLLSGGPYRTFDCLLEKTVDASTNLKLNGQWQDLTNTPLSPLFTITPDEQWAFTHQFDGTGQYGMQFFAQTLDATTCVNADIKDHWFTLKVTLTAQY